MSPEVRMGNEKVSGENYYKRLFLACVMYGSNVWCESMKSRYARNIMNREL